MYAILANVISKPKQLPQIYCLYDVNIYSEFEGLPNIKKYDVNIGGLSGCRVSNNIYSKLTSLHHNLYDVNII